MPNAIWVILYGLPYVHKSEYLDWFHEVHIPEKLARPGYTWASHYQILRDDNEISVNGENMECIAMFGGLTTSVFYNPSPIQMAPVQPRLTREMMACRSNSRALILSSEWAADELGVIGEKKSAIDADRISVVLCDVADNDMDFGAWLIQDHLKSIAKDSGCISVRKLLASTGGSRHAIFHESADPAAAPGAFANPEHSEWSAGVEAYLTYPLGEPMTATRLWPAPDRVSIT